MSAFEKLIVSTMFLFVIIGFITTTFIVFQGSDSINDLLNTNESNLYTNVSSTEIEKQTEKEFYEAYDKYRMNHNLGDINRSDMSELIAEDKSLDMAKKDYFSHTSPDGTSFRERISKYSNDCVSSSENIAKNHFKERVDIPYGGTEKYNTPEELGKALLEQYENSREHRINMENERWDKHGIDVVLTDENEVYHTHIFCDD